MTAPELRRSQLLQRVLINAIWGFNIVATKLSVAAIIVTREHKVIGTGS